jgi:hypothetical protein
MKFSESQAPLYERTVSPELGESGFLSPYEHILNNIVREVMRARDSIWGNNFGLDDLEVAEDEKESYIEKMVEHFIELTENEILITHDWNLNTGSGEEILSQILRFSN